jgi:hypothetical protein
MEKVDYSEKETSRSAVNGKHDQAGARKTRPSHPQIKSYGTVNRNTGDLNFGASAAATAVDGGPTDLTPQERRRWQHMYEFRKNVLDFPEKAARERSDRMIAMLRLLKSNQVNFRKEVPAEFSIAEVDLTATEKRRYAAMVRTRAAGGMSLEQADESARRTIERSRFHSALRKKGRYKVTR